MDDDDDDDDNCYLLQNSSSGKAASNHNEGKKKYTFDGKPKHCIGLLGNGCSFSKNLTDADLLGEN